MDVSEHDYVEKPLLKMFLTEDEVLMGYKDTDQNISATSLTLLSGGMGNVWSTITKTRAVMPLL